jgi:hypothetical protein
MTAVRRRASEEERRKLDYFAAAIMRESGVEVRIVLLRGTGGRPLGELALTEARRLEVGRRTDGRGLLLVVDTETDEMRIEVGRRLEGIFTDGFVGWMIRGNTRTFASADATWLGLHSTLLLLHYRLREAALGQEFSPSRLTEEHDPTRLAVGGGAPASLRGDTGYFVHAANRALRERLVPQPTPELLMARHAEWLAQPTFMPQAEIFTEDSQEYLASFEATAALRDYWRYMEAGRSHRIVVRGDRALVIYPHDPLVHPRFLRRTRRGWQIDEAASLINVEQLAGEAWSWSLRETNDAYHQRFRDLYEVHDRSWPIVRLAGGANQPYEIRGSIR